MARRSVRRREPWEDETCGTCVWCTPYLAFHTLTVRDRKPTMGTCPNWTQSKCVLLSQRACAEWGRRENAI